LYFTEHQTNPPLDWRFLAEDDLIVAEYPAANMNPTPTHIAFNCREAAEKHLKSSMAISKNILL